MVRKFSRGEGPFPPRERPAANATAAREVIAFLCLSRQLVGQLIGDLDSRLGNAHRTSTAAFCQTQYEPVKRGIYFGRPANPVIQTGAAFRIGAC